MSRIVAPDGRARAFLLAAQLIACFAAGFALGSDLSGKEAAVAVHRAQPTEAMPLFLYSSALRAEHYSSEVCSGDYVCVQGQAGDVR